MGAEIKGWARIAVLGVLAALAPVLLSSPSQTAEREPLPWAPIGEIRDPESGDFCCNHQDCDPLDDNLVSVAEDGYSLWNGEFIPWRRVIAPRAGWERDGRYWRCKYLSGERKGKTRCFVAPDRSM